MIFPVSDRGTNPHGTLRGLPQPDGLKRMLAGQKALVTGAGWFIGSHLTEVLVKAGANVTAMVILHRLNGGLVREAARCHDR